MGQKKSSAIYLSVIGFWAFCVLWLDPRLLALFEGGLIQSLAGGLFVALLNVFWLFGGFYLMLALFTVIDRFLPRVRVPALERRPRVAVLYATMNDFQERAALSCTAQDYPDFQVFILDDSTDWKERARIDRFASQCAAPLTVIRRPDRRGYKAGNLNHALRTEVKGFSHFAVVDADNVLPSSFLTEILPYFALSEEVAFVQASHRPHPDQPTPFARDLALSISLLWHVFYAPRNRFGNVIFLGHGGVVRYDVWEAVGGFPEVVAEDLAFSTRAAQLGYRGWYAHQVCCYEEYPAGYQQLRRQQEKYIRGACEYLHREFWPFFRSRRPRWFEKLDVLLSCTSLFLPALFLAFMMVFCVMLPLLVGVRNLLTVEAFGRVLFHLPVVLLPGEFDRLWTWDYFVLTALCTLSPALGALAVILRHPIRGMKMLLLSAVPHLSLLVMAAAAIGSYLVSRKAPFLVTGDRSAVPAGGWDKARADRWGASGDLTHAAEYCVGALFLVACALTLNVGLLAFGLAVLLSAVLTRVPWEWRPLRPLLYLPFLLVCGGMATTSLALVSAQGAFLSVFYFHF